MLCYNDQDEQNQIPISSVFLDAKSEGSAPAEFVLMDCTNFKLPDSGKTISERFNINMKIRPTIFVSGKYIGGKPKQIPQKHLKTGHMLNKALKSVLEPKTVKITNTKELKKSCLDKEMCALFLKGDSNANNNKKIKEVIQSLIVSYPKITFASMDASTLLLSNLEEHVPLANKGQHQFLMFEKVSGSFAVPTSDDTKNKKDDEEEEGEEEETKNKKTTDNSTKKSSGRLITSISTYKGYNMDYNSLSTYLDSVVSAKKDKPIKLSTLPQIKTRTKKLEKQYEEKRQRYQDRKAKKQNTASSSSSNTFSSSSSSSSSGGTFEDGSKEARKAERDRRRAEHLKAQGATERTPEEIAERERQRRKRMEEEAAKWNMVPEDAPEEGEYVGEEEPLESMFEEEDGETSSTYVEEEDDESIEDLDDEDVLDLD